MNIIVDSNVILDIFTQDEKWFNWSNDKLEELMDDDNILVINPIIYTEVSIGFTTMREYDIAMGVFGFQKEEITDEGLFLAGKAFVRYKSMKGNKSNVLPDFFIGAHAEVKRYQILTRDSARYHTYFPKVKLITP